MDNNENLMIFLFNIIFCLILFSLAFGVGYFFKGSSSNSSSAINGSLYTYPSCNVGCFYMREGLGNYNITEDQIYSELDRCSALCASNAENISIDLENILKEQEG